MQEIHQASSVATNGPNWADKLMAVSSALGIIGAPVGILVHRMRSRLSSYDKRIKELEKNSVMSDACERNHGRFVAEFRRIAEEEKQDRKEFRTELLASMTKLHERMDEHLRDHARG
jgi:hypothetical protein